MAKYTQQELFSAARVARAAGKHDAAKTLEQAGVDAGLKANPLTGTARSVTEGSSFGIGDELGVGLASLVAAGRLTPPRKPMSIERGPDGRPSLNRPPAPQSPDVGDIYRDMRGTYNAEQGQFREENPGLSMGAEGGAALLSGMGIGSAIPKLGSMGSQIPAALRYPGAGALAGGGSGAAFAPEGERIAGAGQGALLGGILGAAVPAATTAGGWLGRKVQHAWDKRPFSYRKLEQEMARDGTSPSNLNARLRRFEGTTIADVAGPNVTDLADNVAQMPGGGRAKAYSTLTRREARSPQIARQAADSTTRRTGGYYEEIDRLTRQRADEAGPIYQRWVNNPRYRVPDFTPSAYVKSVMDRLRADPLNDELVGLPENSLPLINKASSEIYKRMAELRRNVGSKGAADELRRLGDQRSALLRQADDAFPEFADARRAWEQPSHAMELIDEGLDYAKERPEALRRRMSDLTQEEQDYFRTGVYQSMMDQMESLTDRRSVYQVFNNPAKRARLEAVMGNRGDYLRLMHAVKTEGMKKATKNRILGNSATQRRLAKANDAGIDPGGLAGAAGQLATGDAVGASANLARTVMGRMKQAGMSEEDAAQFAKLVFEADPTKQAAILKEVEALAARQGALATGATLGTSTAATPASAVLERP